MLQLDAARSPWGLKTVHVVLSTLTSPLPLRFSSFNSPIQSTPFGVDSPVDSKGTRLKGTDFGFGGRSVAPKRRKGDPFAKRSLPGPHSLGPSTCTWLGFPQTLNTPQRSTGDIKKKVASCCGGSPTVNRLDAERTLKQPPWAFVRPPPCVPTPKVAASNIHIDPAVRREPLVGF